MLDTRAARQLPSRPVKVPRDVRRSRSELEEPKSLTAGRLGRLAAALFALFVPALVDPGAVRRAADLYPLAVPPHPYFAVEHAGLLYLWMPLVVLSGTVLLLAPGLLMSLALGAGRSVAEWILSGLALSLVVVSAVAAVVQQILGGALRGGAFAAVVVACTVGAAAFLALRLRRGAELPWPLTSRNAAATLLSIVAVPMIFLVLLVPKFFWEDFNGDGLHTYQAARRLLTSPVPFLSSSAAFTTYPGVRTALLSYPQAWYLRLFGECEASVRLPYLVFLGGLYSALLAAVEHKRADVVRTAERALLWAGLMVYAVVMAYSATYNPYHADIALPAAQDTLLLALFLGFAVAAARDAHGWASFHLVLAYICSPAGLMLAALWIAASLLLVRPVPWRTAVAPVITIAACFAAERALPAAMLAAGLPVPGSEHGLRALASVLAKFTYPRWRRLAFLALPSGIAPAAALACWRSQDRFARTCTLVALASFAFFFVQRKNAAHYYAPAMVLPLVTLWRLDVWARERWRKPALAAVASGALLALAVSLPKELSAYSYGRLVGETVVDRVAPRDPFDLSGYRRSRVLNKIIPLESAAAVPLSSYGEACTVFYFYRNRDPLSPAVNYVIQPAGDPPPAGMQLGGVYEDTALYIKDRSVLEAHLALRPPLYGSRLYVVPKNFLFAR